MADALALSTDLVVYAARAVRMIRHMHDNPADTRVLSLLDQHGAVSVTGLARLDNCAQPTMSAAVSNLVKTGLAAKQANPDDARGTVVTLTDAGRQELLDRRTAFGATVLERLVAAGHTEAELATAVAVLRGLLGTDTSGGNK